jgi:hypothetical protein
MQNRRSITKHKKLGKGKCVVLYPCPVLCINCRSSSAFLY